MPSVLASGGLSLPIIGALLGHSTPVTTARYAHLLDDPLRQATERVGSLWTALSTGASGEVVPLRSGRAELMPIERFPDGRKYTERQFIRQIGDPTEADRQEAQAALDRLREAATSPDHNFNAVVAWATAQLQRSGKPSAPDELMGPPYDEDVAAREQVLVAGLVCAHAAASVLRGDGTLRARRSRGAMDECIALGYLHHEALQVAGTVRKQRDAGAAPKLSDEAQRGARAKDAVARSRRRRSGTSTLGGAIAASPGDRSSQRAGMPEGYSRPQSGAASPAKIVGSRSKIRTKNM